MSVILGFKFTFEDHFKNVLAKTNKAVGFLQKLWNLFRRTTLITIYKAFIYPHLDYSDILYDQASNKLFKEKLESCQYNACLALTGAKGYVKRKNIWRIGIRVSSKSLLV